MNCNINSISYSFWECETQGRIFTWFISNFWFIAFIIVLSIFGIYSIKKSFFKKEKVKRK